MNECNQKLAFHASCKKSYFIGILDTSGFDVFEENNFEQLCFNFVRDKVQFFLNNFTFNLEQEEYLKQELNWNYLDFKNNNNDPSAAISLIEKVIFVKHLLLQLLIFIQILAN